VQLTKAETAVGSFSWSPDGKTIAYAASPQEPEDRKKHLGDFQVVRRDYSYSHIWTVSVEEAIKAPGARTQRTRGKDYSVSGFRWSPDGSKIAFSASVNPDLVRSDSSDVYVLTLADNSVKKVVEQPGPDRGPQWSPDGKWLVFSSAMRNPRFFHANSRLAVVPSEGGAVRSITDTSDEQPNLLEWKDDGVSFTALQKTVAHVFRADPQAGGFRGSRPPRPATACRSLPTASARPSRWGTPRTSAKSSSPRSPPGRRAGSLPAPTR
jgi:Tol biopolymer transport system component